MTIAMDTIPIKDAPSNTDIVWTGHIVDASEALITKSRLEQIHQDRSSQSLACNESQKKTLRIMQVRFTLHP